MDSHLHDIFYLNSHNLSPEIREELCREAHSKCFTWWVDNSPGWQRQRIDMSLDEILKYLYTETIHFSIIHRKNFDNCLEVGFCTMGRNHKNGDLFLWIRLDEKYIEYFLKKYKLTKNK